MKALKIKGILLSIIFLLVACHPQIYLFNVDPKSIGPDDVIHVSWKVEGVATLLIHDLNYPGTGNTKLAPIDLLITMDGKTTTFRMPFDSTLKIPLAGEDSLRIIKKADNENDDRLRYTTLVVSRDGQ